MTDALDVFVEMVRECIVGAIVNDIARQLRYDIDTYGQDVVCAYLYAYPVRKESSNG